MDTNRKEIKELFRKYLDGALTPEETSRLKLLVTEMDRDSLDDHLNHLWNDYSSSGKRNQRAFDEISFHLKEMVRPPREKKRIRLFWRSAAAVLIPLLLFTTFYFYQERTSLRSLIAREYQVMAGKGERASVVLPDGTKVYLNSQSKLTYPASFDVDHRFVNLSGEAYFEVTHDEKSPFIVSTPQAKVKVLGTTFNLYAYPGQEMFEATLVEGKVQVIPDKMPDKAVVLAPRQKVYYDVGTGALRVIEADLRVETAWKRGDLLFRSQSFMEIVARLESFYGMNIRVKGTLPGELFTGSFHENDIHQVLRNLQQHYGFTFQKTGNEICLTFK